MAFTGERCVDYPRIYPSISKSADRAGLKLVRKEPWVKRRSEAHCTSRSYTSQPHCFYDALTAEEYETKYV